jgi:short-subunit dehydrogenase
MKPYALITGASKGIGKAIATQLAQLDYNVLLISRSEIELKDLAESIKTTHQVDAQYLAIDLSVTGAAGQVVGWVNELTVPLAILINNAGYGVFGRFAETQLADHLNMMNLNINAVVELTHQLLPVLQQNKQAYILNVASTTAYQAMPALSTYGASKTFVLSFTRALAYELKDTPVSVSCLSPGATETSFIERAGMDDFKEFAAKFSMQPDEVARIALKGMFNKKVEIVPGFLNRLGVLGATLLNKRFIERIAARMYKM